MSILLIGSGLLALGGFGAGFALRRRRRRPAVELVQAHAGPLEGGCPVCLARAANQAKNS